MKSMRCFSYRRAAILLFCCLACLCSCTRKLDAPLALTVPIDISSDMQWAVVTVPYVTFRLGAGLEEGNSFHARKGDVLTVKGCSYIGTDGHSSNMWYGFEQGWLPETAVDVYSNRLRAESAARELL